MPTIVATLPPAASPGSRCGLAGSTTLFSAQGESARSTCRGRSSCRSDGWRWKRTSKRCSASICPARPSSSATDRFAAVSSALPPRVFSRFQTGRRVGRHLCERGRVRLPLAHRHIRDRHDRGDGQRLAGRGLSRARADRCRRGGAGVLDEDLRAACLKALTLSREQAREHSMRFTWKESARQFLDNIEGSRSDVKLPTVRRRRPSGRAAGRESLPPRELLRPLE